MLNALRLEPDLQELFSTLVEAQRSLPRHRRQKFMVFPTGQGVVLIRHPAWPHDEAQPYSYKNDFEELARLGLLSSSYAAHNTVNYDITTDGYGYYEDMKRQQGDAVGRVEMEIRRFLDADHFRRTYPTAHQKWTAAEALLWGNDSERQLTTIGHLCREAMQEFATALANRHHISDVPQDKAKTVARIRAVLDGQATRMGEAEREFLNALLAYWGTVSDLVQRQEHGGQKAGASLVWADARRVVYQSANVMFEIEQSVSGRT